MKWEVGQRVCVVTGWSRRVHAEEDFVAAIGRKWATLAKSSRYRFNIETGEIDGGGYSSPGRVWPSAEEYNAHLARVDKWDKVKEVARNNVICPDHINDAQLDELLRILSGGTDRGQ